MDDLAGKQRRRAKLANQVQIVHGKVSGLGHPKWDAISVPKVREQLMVKDKRKRWALTIPNGDGDRFVHKKTVWAHTKSEARAHFKRILKSPRVPVGMFATQIPV